MIKSIIIKNYRGIKDLEIDNFKKYNFFIGDNGSKKTTILESLGIGVTLLDFDRILRNARNRKMKIKKENVSSLFFNSDTNNTIKIILETTDNVKVETIVYKIIPDNNSALNAFNNKEVDVTSITAEQAKGFKDDPRLVSNNDGSVWYLLFNFNNKTLANVKIRKALLMAIDREGLVNNILNGYGTAAKTLVPKGIGIKGLNDKDFTEGVPTSTLAYNPQEAKKLLEEGLKETGAAKFPNMSMLINESGNNKVIAEYIQEQLRKNLGIELNLEIMTAQERFSRMKQKNFDLVLAGWSGDYPDAITYLDLFESTGGTNYGSYKNPQYDALVKTVRGTADQNVRIPALVKLEGIIAEDLPVGVLFHREKQYLVNKKVNGIGFTPIGGEFYFGSLSLK